MILPVRRGILVALVLGACARAPHVAPVATDIPRVGPNPAIERAPGDAGKPTRAAGGSQIVDLALGHARGCAVRADGHVVCWGASMLDEPPSWPAAPTLVPGLDDAVEISGDDPSWCARRKSGEVVCWSAYAKPKPVGVMNAVQLGTMCARVVDGSIACWGDQSPAPPVSGARALSRGNGATCIVSADRTVACWGENAYGQVGDGTRTSRSTPYTVPGVTGADEVQSQYFFGTCARSGGAIKCWGGEGGSPTPVEVKGIADAVQLAVTEYHACVRRSDGTIACWGGNNSQQLGGAADAPDSSDPVPVPGSSGTVLVAVGGGEPCGGCGSTCVLDKSGNVTCWGSMVDREGTRATLDLRPTR